jgi:DNA-directed RNA polymerase specialized sigma24 family protein
MAPTGSVTHWLQQLTAGDRTAVERLWQRYYPQLVRLALRRLEGAGLGGDAEDVALSAFRTFCNSALQGRCPDLLDRDDLWGFLVVVTVRKALNWIKHEQAAKRGGGEVQNFVDLQGATNNEAAALPEFLSREPDPQTAAAAADECRRLLALLGDPVLQSVAVWKLEGHTNEEIAALLGRSLPTVERKLKLIRKLWEEEGTP